MNETEKNPGGVPLRQPSLPNNNGGGLSSLTNEQKAIIDYAVQAMAGVNAGQTEEIVSRTRHSVHTEINQAFETFTKVSTTRKIWMTVGAVLAFGGGFLVKGWLKPKQLPAPNGVPDDVGSSRLPKY